MHILGFSTLGQRKKWDMGGTCISKLWVRVTRHHMCEAFRKLLVGPLIVTLRKISSFSFGERSPRAPSAFGLGADTDKLRVEPGFFAIGEASSLG